MRAPSLALLAATLPLATASTRAATEFNRDIRPILTKHCTACHGGVKAAGGVSFVYRDKALASGKSGERTIVPGQPDASELIRRITSSDPDEVMPKPEHGPRLSPADTATLRQWIADGAPWSEHWSLIPPANPPVPPITRTDWPRQPLDAFVLARLEAENLTPSPDATPAAWLRRASLDLTGLPPSPEDWKTFAADFATHPQTARTKAVDRLLASPAYGEHWAALWLDLARYSDTYGFEKDPHRDIWPWRDWVVRAFNADLPFDQFTIRQLAGDLLPNPSNDDLLATAFHRNTQNNSEGGTDDEEWRDTAVHDRVNTTWTVWQATTFACVQCHAHPYDPFPHEDYYRFKAFFNSTEDCDQNDDFPRFTVSPNPQAAALFQKVNHLLREITAAGTAACQQAPDWNPLNPSAATASGGQLTIAAEGNTITASGTMPIGVSYEISLPAPRGLTALRLRILPDSSDPTTWPEKGCMITECSLAASAGNNSQIPVPIAEVIADHQSGPYRPLALAGGGDLAGFGGYPVLDGPRWAVFVLATPLAADSTLKVTLKHNAPVNSGFQGTPTRHFAFDASSAPLASPERQQLIATWRETRAAYAEIKGPAVPVLTERPAPRETRLYARGNRLSREAAQPPAWPATLGPSPEQPNRLAMAQWLVSDRNPLTARVTANRFWAALFGRGIVETLEDFGSSGALPSHQPLLDHLALRLSSHHRWSLKSFLRELALSATYAQSSAASPALVARDPANSLLARGPRQRLTAEMIRDHALTISGLLSQKSGGPPVFPPQPDGVWSSVYSGASWETSTGEDRYRRALYTYSKRTSGYPGFLAFDAPARDLCTPRRLPTNTPLQALVTLNDPAFLEMAGALASRIAATSHSPRNQIAHAVSLITLEPPPEEIVIPLVQLYDAALAAYRRNPGEAAQLAASPEAAALTLVANTLLNSDFALNR
jgi:hypothetical protein